MPIEASFLEDGGVILKGTGHIGFQDVSSINEKLYETPESIGRLRYQLSDYTEVQSVQLDSEEIRALGLQDSRAAKLNPNMVIAVVGKDDLLFGLLRMWEAYASERNFETRVFREVDAARAWIAETLQKRQSNS